MQNTKLQSIAMSILAVGLVFAAEGCGSSSGSGNYAATCMQGCAKILPCEADAGFSETMAQCVAGCTASAMTSSGAPCANAAAMQQAANACLSKTSCADLLACGESIPQCQAGTGGTSGSTGGTSGNTGGTSGNTGGTSGSTGGAGGAGTGSGCADCDKANTCCQALATLLGQSAASCTYSTAMCNSQPTSSQSQYASACQTILSTGASLAPSSCQ